MANLKFIGFGNETTFGTAVSSVVDIDVADANINVRSDAPITYAGALLKTDRYVRPGLTYVEGDVNYGTDVNSIPYFIRYALGEYAYDATPSDPDYTGLFLHESWGGNKHVLPSFTTYAGKDTIEFKYRGSVLDTLGLTVDNEFLMASISMRALSEEKLPFIRDIDSLNLTQEFPLVFHECKLKVNGSEVTNISFSLDISNSLSEVATIGNKVPDAFITGAREITGSFEARFLSDVYYSLFYNGETSSDTSNTIDEFPIELTCTTIGGKAFIIKLPAVYITGLETPIGERTEIVQTISFKAKAGGVTLEDGSTVNTDIHILTYNAEADITA